MASGGPRRRLAEPGDPDYVAPARAAADDFWGQPPVEMTAGHGHLASSQHLPLEALVVTSVAAPVVAAGVSAGSASRENLADDGNPAPGENPGSSENPADDETATPAEGADGTAPEKKRKGLSEPALWAVEITAWVAAAIVLSTLLRLFVFQMFLVPSDSMDDTLQDGDRIAALKLADFQRGDIVVFSDPGGWLSTPAKPVSAFRRFFENIGVLASTDEQYLVKRVIGLPGDHVQCCSAAGRLIVNGVELDEGAYLKEPSRPASGITFDIVVPAGRVFVMGDNRYHSADSRFHLCQMTADGLGMNAFVPEENIVGPVRAIVLPFKRTGHRPVPVEVFGPVPAPSGDPPATPSINVSGGLSETCHS